MSGARIVGISYLVLSIYALLVISLTTLDVKYLFPSFLQLLLVMLAFAAGYFGNGRSRTAPVPIDRHALERNAWSLGSCLVLGLGLLVASVLSTGYYTGMGPGDVLANVQSGNSLYIEYQSYNRELAIAGGDGLSPWLALLVFRMATMLSAVFWIIPRGDRILPREWMILACVVLSQAYSGVARGTGFEFFQLGTALLVAVLMRPRPKRASGARNSLIIGSGIGLAVLYSWLLAARGMTAPSLGPGNDIRFEQSWLSGLLGPGITQSLLTFYDYFGFGFQYVATFWSNVWFVSPGSIMAGLLPGGFYSLGVDPLLLMRQHIEVGVRWQPDSIRIVSALGVLGLLLICFVLGRWARNLEEGPRTLAARILSYFVILQMISLPVGNFVWVDRSSLVVALWLIGIEFLRGLGAVPPTFREFFDRGRSERLVSRR